MGKKILIVVDMQNDFVTGALRNEEGMRIVPLVQKKVEQALANGDRVLFTKDTHYENYMQTEEGTNLPVPHCIKASWGWEIVDELKEFADKETNIFLKETFGSSELGKQIAQVVSTDSSIEGIELVGLCTDICVISNAVIAKAFAPNIPIYVDAACCAGVTPQSHDTAVAAMEAFQIHVEHKGEEPWRVD
ncbi:MAG: cysteine hydrolase [Lachnospiraceae bacterium]|nr:cysteine hydrolase [Lachnospiraceae bacterium]